jgi:hypothetical protein
VLGLAHGELTLFLFFSLIVRARPIPKSSEEIKEKMLDLSATRLPVICGDRYTAIVMRCLHCVEEDGARATCHGDDDDEQPEVEIGMAGLSASAEQSESRRPQAKVYLQSVLEDLDEIIV